MGLSERRHFLYRRHRHTTVDNSAVQCTSILRQKLHHTISIGSVWFRLTERAVSIRLMIWSGLLGCAALLGCVLWR